MKKKIFALLMAALMLVSIAACGGGGDSSATPTPGTTNGGGGDSGTVSEAGEGEGGGGDEGASAATGWQPAPGSLEGREFLIGDWWTANDAPRRAPQNLRAEQREDMLLDFEAEYGFTIKNWGVSGWGDYLEMFTTSVMAQSPEADVWVMSSTWAYQLMAQGLLYPLDTLESLNLEDEKWNSAITRDFTGNDGHVYAISAAKFVEPRNFLFYNKRLFAEAGIDPEEPYNLQASGDWTWDKFWEYCEKLTRDLDGDGLPDVWAFTGFWGPTQLAFINSNNARHVGIDADGKFYNATMDPEFLEAMEFVYRFYNAGHWTLGPEDAEWDWFTTGFMDGHAAMCIPVGAYQSETFLEMSDEWGLLFPPKGPKANDYNTMFEENVFVLPFNIGEEKATEIMFAFNLYTQPVPYDIENPEYWKEDAWGYQRWKDARAVDETLTMFYEGRMELNSKVLIDPGSNWWGESFDWGVIQNAHESSVIEKIEEARPILDARIAEVNAQAGG